ncbi:hypothetical protein QWY75_12595 [Pontixanthobacter aestiaquae]|uniref:Uncharacterized protein n=1 Tax=Pontixanthobacter aestiaquae TaxID=1509367 RepID=A0A844Z7U6_9SPHN|nr:hypothetical protein [Pontixanthobacter aestiaquae]MDN3647043.1 hypothetical protein [Pontixanthobacter aestiaquae]MXO81979.1 hypothetical protein [Pontixanthobacter aestiaquae]
MSRSALRMGAMGLAMLWLASSFPATAQNAPSLTAEEAAENAKAAYGPPPPKPKCDPQEGDEIVVCAEEQDQSQFRVKSSSELDPTSEEAIKDGLPRAPDVGGPGIFKGPATVGGLCLIPPCPKEAALIIDVTALPEAPPGSDADRISRGLPPLGQNEAPEGSLANPVTESPDKPEKALEPTDGQLRLTLPESSSPAVEPSDLPNR